MTRCSSAASWICTCRPSWTARSATCSSGARAPLCPPPSSRAVAPITGLTRLLVPWHAHAWGPLLACCICWTAWRCLCVCGGGMCVGRSSLRSRALCSAASSRPGACFRLLRQCRSKWWRPSHESAACLHAGSHEAAGVFTTLLVSLELSFMAPGDGPVLCCAFFFARTAIKGPEVRLNTQPGAYAACHACRVLHFLCRSECGVLLLEV